MNKKFHPTPEQQQYIIDNYQQKTHQQIAKVLGVGKVQVRNFCLVRDLKKQVGRGRQKLPCPVLTEVQIEWLESNISKYTNPDLARRLGLKLYRFIELKKQLGLKKSYNKPPKLNDEQRKYIEDNYLAHTNSYIASVIGVKKYLVYRYCAENNLRKQKAVVSIEPPKVISYKTETKPLQRPPAVYSNVSREQHIDRYLSM